ncbi:MAG: GMP/IMP nucleotidase [Gammaproteobacteria bacterium]|nr:GMP/IMP nucleotidase [Gammaproteobacteria bacterium]
MFNGQRIDTILIDMDGTILDLAYDNYFWRELVPRCVARARGLDPAPAREQVYALYEGKLGTLDWYCLDYWTDTLRLDLRSLKAASSQRIRFLPGAREFLLSAMRSGLRMALVTNAHGVTLEIKRGVAGLDRYFDQLISAHDFGCAKEHATFWPALHAALDFNPDTTVMVDDSLPVLDAAAAFGIALPLAVRRPDTRQPDKNTGQHAAISGLGDPALADLLVAAR